MEAFFFGTAVLPGQNWFITFGPLWGCPLPDWRGGSRPPTYLCRTLFPASEDAPLWGMRGRSPGTSTARCMATASPPTQEVLGSEDGFEGGQQRGKIQEARFPTLADPKLFMVKVRVCPLPPACPSVCLILAGKGGSNTVAWWVGGVCVSHPVSPCLSCVAFWLESRDRCSNPGWIFGQDCKTLGGGGAYLGGKVKAPQPKRTCIPMQLCTFQIWWLKQNCTFLLHLRQHHFRGETPSR